MGQGFHKVHPKKHTNKHGIAGKIFDKSMYGMALIAPIMTVPQLYDIWVHHRRAGVSLATWAAYAFVTGLWLTYGILHKEKQLILVNFLLLILDSAIVAGILFLH